jgi:hypothetical protein
MVFCLSSSVATRAVLLSLRCLFVLRQHGYVETLLGRRRYLPNIHSQDPGERAQAERQAVNSVCQGSAADLIKLAMINIHHHQERLFKVRHPQGLAVALQVHRPRPDQRVPHSVDVLLCCAVLCYAVRPRPAAL